MERNQALVITAPGQIVLEDRLVPVPAKDEALIEVQYVALCGSDSKLYNGTYTAPHRYPVVVGHEWIGRVVQTGNGDKELRPGTPVTGDCSVYCGACPKCAVNRNHCIHIEKRGITVDGGCANYITVKRRHLYQCPQSGDCKALVLTEPVSVGVNGILNRVPERVLHRAGSAVILGSGGIGIMSMLVLCEFPIRRIVMVDTDRDKLDLIDSFNLPHVQTCRNPDELEQEFDIVVEAAGQSETLRRCPSLAASTGHIVCLGHQNAMEFDFGSVIKKSLTIHASNGSTGGFEQAMQIIMKRREIMNRLITATIPLAQAPAYIAGDMKKQKNIKVVIDMMARQAYEG